MIISEMQSSLDKTQYGNQKKTSIQHYLVKLIHRIQSSLDNNSRGQVMAALLSLLDWREAFSRQCHILGVKRFISNGVRPALIPCLLNYFQNRKMQVKWHSKLSTSRNLPGGGAMGATFGIWEFLSQTNHNIDCVPEEDRFKWVDDVTLIEILNLISIGLTSLYVRPEVPNDLPEHGQWIPGDQTKTQKYLNTINQWTEDHKMALNPKKSKIMIINHTHNYQFGTRLKIGSDNVDCVQQAKILGTIFEDDLKWNANTSMLVKKANARMCLLRTAVAFGASTEDKKIIYITFIRSILEQSAVVWGSSLSVQNINDLERCQKNSLRLIDSHYSDYEKSLSKLNLRKLSDRRKFLSLKFAKGCVWHPKMKHLFPMNEKPHLNLRDKEKYQVFHANTERYKVSPVLFLQRLLNKNHKEAQEK